MSDDRLDRHILSRRESLLGLGAGTTMIASLPLPTAASEPMPESGASTYGFRSINLMQFGYVGDGIHDDTQAWRDAIMAAARDNVRRIIVPWGAKGISLVSRPICEGTLPSGLTFEGDARRQANPDQSGHRVVYTGRGTCWSITSGRGSPATIGQWIWRHLMFEATDPAATMFDFNATERNLLVDGQGASYIVFAAFESCYLKGAGGGHQQLGDAIRATKTFSLVIDKQCQIRDWRRGVWLRGCDDCSIDGRLWLNARSIVHERSGTFGSNLQIRSNWLGRCPDETAEPAYILWDDGSGTAIHGTFFEGHDHGGHRQNEVALVRLNGFGTTLVGCRFAEGHCLEIASLAREVTLVSPGFASHRPENNAIVSPPQSWDFGFQQEDFRVLVIGASKNAVKHLGDHPRLVYRGRMPMTHDTVGGVVPIDMEIDLVADSKGFRPHRRLLTAFNFFAKCDSTIVDGGAALVADPTSSQGWVMTCAASRTQAGLHCAFVIGRDFQVGDELRIAIRAACLSPGWQLQVHRGNVPLTGLGLSLGEGPEFNWQSIRLNLRDWQIGERLAIIVLKTGYPTVDLRIDFVEIANVASAAPQALPRSPVAIGQDDDIASCRSTNAAVNALDARINALEAALRRAGDIA